MIKILKSRPGSKSTGFSKHGKMRSLKSLKEALRRKS